MDEVKSIYNDEFKEFMLNSMGVFLQKLENIEKTFDRFDQENVVNESLDEIK